MSEVKMVKMDYPSNNGKQNNERPKKEVQKAITGSVKKRKKTLSSKLKETFVGEDRKSVSSYLIEDVLLPQIQDMASDVIDSGLEAIMDMISGVADVFIFGEIQQKRNRKKRRHMDYGSLYLSGRSNKNSRRERDKESNNRRRSKGEFNLDDIAFDNRNDANNVLSDMIDILEEEDFITVGDFYRLIGDKPDYVHEEWGWDNLKKAKVRMLGSDEYIIDLPRPIPID